MAWTYADDFARIGMLVRTKDGDRAMTLGAAWTWARARLSPYRSQLRFCLRMTVAALLAFALAQLWTVPLNGLWAVLTAVVVTHVSLRSSLHATIEYVMGTIGGAVYAAAILKEAIAECRVVDRSGRLRRLDVFRDRASQNLNAVLQSAWCDSEVLAKDKRSR